MKKIILALWMFILTFGLTAQSTISIDSSMYQNPFQLDISVKSEPASIKIFTEKINLLEGLNQSIIAYKEESVMLDQRLESIDKSLSVEYQYDQKLQILSKRNINLDRYSKIKRIIYVTCYGLALLYILYSVLKITGLGIYTTNKLLSSLSILIINTLTLLFVLPYFLCIAILNDYLIYKDLLTLF